MKGLIRSPIFDVLALIYEVDLYKKWIPTCSVIINNITNCYSKLFVLI